MRIRVYKRGDTYYLDYGWNGDRQRYPVSKLRKTADKAVSLIQAQDAAGTFLGPKSELIGLEDGPSTIGQLCKDYIAAKQGTIAASTAENYGTALAFIRKHLGDDALVCSVDLKACEQLISARRKDGAVAANLTLKSLKAILNKAVDWNIIAKNPAARLRPTKEKARDRFLTDDEVAQIVSACRQHKLRARSIAWLEDLIVASVWTGARRGDLVGDHHGRPALRWKDVDLDGRMISFHDTKEKETRHVPINSALLPVLKGLRSRFKGKAEPEAAVFVDDRGETIDPFRVAAAFKVAVLRTTIHDKATIRWHDLRHTAASWMAQAGVSIDDIGRVLGHHSAAMTKRYAHLRPDHLVAAVEAAVAHHRHKSDAKES